jgi:hypothetical protein
MVEIPAEVRYAVEMSDPEMVADRCVELGRQEVVAGVSDEPARSLATLRFADHLRRLAEGLSQVSAQTARLNQASWREIGEAVGGITPQGAEHRFSRAAKERRSKAAKVEWASKEPKARS